MSYSLAFSQSVITVLFVADKVQQGMYDFVPTRQLSEALNIAAPTAVKIIQALARAGIIETREGVKGGVRLAKDPADVTMLDVFHAIESGRTLFRTDLNLRVSGDKPDRARRAVAGLLNDAEEAMKANLKKVTVRGLIDELNR